MDKRELEQRTKVFALKTLTFVSTLPQTRTGDMVTHQLLRSGTSIGANYREANRAESRSDFIHKIGIVEKESAETHYWLELCDEAALGNPAQRDLLLSEALQLLKIFTTIGRKTKAGK